MTRLIDLHIHSHYSEDADLPVEELFRVAREASLAAVSITDHDSIESIEDALPLSAGAHLLYIPGVEITTVFPTDGSQQHILGYFVDGECPLLRKTIKRIGECRLLVARERIEALRRIGFILDENRIWKRTGDRAPAATSIMLELFRNEANADDPRLKDYFEGDRKGNRMSFFYLEYLTEGMPAYVPFQSITVEEGIHAVKRAGGIPVLAHPVFVRKREWLDVIAEAGIQGIEAISTYHGREDIEFFLGYAKHRGLLVTAGSDFHGPTSKPGVKLGGITGNDFEYARRLADFHERGK